MISKDEKIKRKKYIFDNIISWIKMGLVSASKFE